jgi:hypothetical protein
LIEGAGMFLYGGADALLPTLAGGGMQNGLLWTDLSCSLPNCDRSQGVLFVDGSIVRFMGGAYNPQYPTPPTSITDATEGLAYDLTAHRWTQWPYPSGTSEHIAYRYADDGRRIYFLHDTNIVTIYDRASSSWRPNDTAPMPSGFCTQAATAWTGSELVAWSGDCGSGAVNVGGRYQPKAP